MQQRAKVAQKEINAILKKRQKKDKQNKRRRMT
jgi:hypothetical protein